MRHGYKIKTYQHGQRGASASVFFAGIEVHRTRTTQGDPWEGYQDGSDRRAAAFAAWAWVREQRQDATAGELHSARVTAHYGLALPLGVL